MSSAKSLVINCGASHIAYAVFSQRAGQVAIEELYTEDLQYDYSEEEGWLYAITDRLKHILSQSKFKGKCHLIAPGYQLLTKTIKVPHVEANRQRQIIAVEAQQSIPYPLSEVVWDHQIIADDGVEAEVILIAFKAIGANRFCNEISQLGLQPESVQASSILDYNAYIYNYPQVEGCTLLINIGARSSNLLFIDETGFFVRNIALGGNSLTQNLADSMGKPFLQAEETKISYFSGLVEFSEDDPALQVIQRSSENFMKRMSQEITRSIVNYRRQKQGASPNCILLTGRGSLLPGLAETLAETQHVPIDWFNPTGNVAPGGTVTRQHLDGSFYMLSELVGQGSRSVMPSSVGINLLPQNIASSLNFKRKKPLLMTAAAMLAIAPTLPMVHYMTAASSYEQQAREIQQQVAPMQQRHNQLLELKDDILNVQNKITQIERLIKSKPNWVNFFADLQDRLVSAEDVWLDELKVIRGSENKDNYGSQNDSEDTPKADEPYLLRLKGRLLLREATGNVDVIDSQEASRRVNSILQSFTTSEFIVSLEGQPRFKTPSPLIIEFNFTLKVNPEKPL